jgi:hypothetical protein
MSGSEAGSRRARAPLTIRLMRIAIYRQQSWDKAGKWILGLSVRLLWAALPLTKRRFFPPPYGQSG